LPTISTVVSMKSLAQEKLLDYSDMPSVATNVFVPVQYKNMLRYLSDKTRIRQSEYMREAMHDLLVKYRNEFRGSDFEF